MNRLMRELKNYSVSASVLIVAFTFITTLWAGLPAAMTSFTAGTTIKSSEVNTNFTTLFDVLNGNVDAANITDDSLKPWDLDTVGPNWVFDTAKITTTFDVAGKVTVTASAVTIGVASSHTALASFTSGISETGAGTFNGTCTFNAQTVQGTESGTVQAATPTFYFPDTTVGKGMKWRGGSNRAYGFDLGLDSASSGNLIIYGSTNDVLAQALSLSRAGSLTVSQNITATGDIYKGSTAYANPDYVFEQAYTGKIVKYAKNDGADEYQPMTLDETEAYTKKHMRLPGVADNEKPTAIFKRADIALREIEKLYLVAFEQNKRIKNLERALVASNKKQVWR